MYKIDEQYYGDAHSTQMVDVGYIWELVYDTVCKLLLVLATERSQSSDARFLRWGHTTMHRISDQFRLPQQDSP
jgi:hypothetical protein